MFRSNLSRTKPITLVESLLTRKVLRKLLFDQRIPVYYHHVLETFRACEPKQSESESIPSEVTGADIMLLKRALEHHRKTTGLISPPLSQIEANLVEAAAERGDQTAIALLCGSVLSDERETKANKDHADNLLRQLMDARFGLAFKICGDLAFKVAPAKARLLYELAIQSELPDNALKTECMRSMALILFGERRVSEAQVMFEDAIATASDPGQVMDCHFYLAQIYDADKQRVRHHLTQAARHGLKDAIAPLGFVHLNYFGDVDIAREWFQLGIHGGDINSAVGLFDVYVRERAFNKAHELIERISNSKDGSKALEFRKDTIQRVRQMASSNPHQETTSSPDRWA